MQKHNPTWKKIKYYDFYEKLNTIFRYNFGKMDSTKNYPCHTNVHKHKHFYVL